MHAAVNASISSQARPYMPHAIVALVTSVRRVWRGAVGSRNVHAVSVGRVHFLPLRKMRATQQASAPPGRLEHLDPLQMPQLAAQQTPFASEVGLCGSSSCVAAMPAVQKRSAGAATDLGAAAAAATVSAVASLHMLGRRCSALGRASVGARRAASRASLDARPRATRDLESAMQRSFGVVLKPPKAKSACFS